MQMLSRTEMLRSRADCPACGSQSRREVCSYDPATAWRCGACGVVYLSPYVTSEGMKQIYASPEALARYFPFCDSYFEDTLSENRDSRTFRIYQEWLGKQKKTAAGRKRRDMCCGGGQFLRLASERGWQAEGLEFDNTLEKKLKEQGMPVRSGDFLEMPIEHGSFDVVTLWDVFEHFSDPIAALRRCRDILKPDGIMLIACPKENSALARLAEFFFKLSGGKVQYPVKVVYLLDHPLFYSPKNLESLLEKGNFRVVESRGDETDLRRVTVSFPARLALRTLFFLSRPLGLQNRMIVLARKL
jgi:2-polyprenyl-3-methyl-5-hydroxy-6-metoxy-1,4-benzoquinol methylase